MKSASCLDCHWTYAHIRGVTLGEFYYMISIIVPGRFFLMWIYYWPAASPVCRKNTLNKRSGSKAVNILNASKHQELHKMLHPSEIKKIDCQMQLQLTPCL